MVYKLTLLGLIGALAFACSSSKKKKETPAPVEDAAGAADSEASEDTGVDTGNEQLDTVEDILALDVSSPDVWTPPEGPFVEFLSPVDGEIAHNPVTFKFQAGNGVVTVALFADDFPLQSKPFDASTGIHEYDFTGVNVLRLVVAEGYSETGQLLAEDAVEFIASEGYLVEPEGFNAFVVRSINDWGQFPKNGTYPYCWKDCPDSMGMVHATTYLGELLWEGEGSCFCTGHTLEVFLDAIRLRQVEYGLGEDEQFGNLTWDSVHGGDFYQHWQGYGVATEASSANAFEEAEIGFNLYEEEWGQVLPGDFVNLSRTNGTGHAVIFISWVREGETIVGLRYYGCNSSADSHPDPNDPSLMSDVSGPSFQTEKFNDFGGKVIPAYLFIGHIVDPLTGF